jgi:hypothetical protein
MPIRTFLEDKSFDPDAIEIMNAAFQGACADLGLTDKSDRACEMVAERIIVLADGKRDAETLRTLVLASFQAKP